MAEEKTAINAPFSLESAFMDLAATMKGYMDRTDRRFLELEQRPLVRDSVLGVEEAVAEPLPPSLRSETVDLGEKLARIHFLGELMLERANNILGYKPVPSNGPEKTPDVGSYREEVAELNRKAQSSIDLLQWIVERFSNEY